MLQGQAGIILFFFVLVDNHLLVEVFLHKLPRYQLVGRCTLVLLLLLLAKMMMMMMMMRGNIT